MTATCSWNFPSDRIIIGTFLLCNIYQEFQIRCPFCPSNSFCLICILLESKQLNTGHRQVDITSFIIGCNSAIGRHIIDWCLAEMVYNSHCVNKRNIGIKKVVAWAFPRLQVDSICSCTIYCPSY